MLKLVALSFFLCFTSASAQYPWLPVNVGKVACFSADSSASKDYSTSVEFRIDNSTNVAGMSAEAKTNRFNPHIISFYRTTSAAVTIKYRAQDAVGNVFISGTAQVNDYLCKRTAATVYEWCPLSYKNNNLLQTTLSDVTKLGTLSGGTGGRRLEDRLRDPQWHPPQVKTEDLLEPEDELEEEELDDEEEDSSSRKLLSGRSLKPKSNPPRRRAPKPKPKPAPTPRRRAPVASGARRRAGAPAATGDRRRISSPVDGKSYKNPNSKSKAGSYGPGSKTKIDKSFKGGYKKTKYGYSGPKSYSSGALMGVAAVGLVVGAGAMYMYSNSHNRYSQWGRSGWGWRNVECDYDSRRDGCWKDQDFIDLLTSAGECGSNSHLTWPSPGQYGSCYECNKHKFYTKCQRKKMKYDLNRDDIMATGFIPNDMKSPIKITVYSVIGNDFTLPENPLGSGKFTPKPEMCPPLNYNASANVGDTGYWAGPTTAKDIYITLTPQTEFANSNMVNAAPVHGLSMILGLCILVLLRLR